MMGVAAAGSGGPAAGAAAGRVSTGLGPGSCGRQADAAARARSCCCSSVAASWDANQLHAPASMCAYVCVNVLRDVACACVPLCVCVL